VCARVRKLCVSSRTLTSARWHVGHASAAHWRITASAAAERLQRRHRLFNALGRFSNGGVFGDVTVAAALLSCLLGVQVVVCLLLRCCRPASSLNLLCARVRPQVLDVGDSACRTRGQCSTAAVRTSAGGWPGCSVPVSVDWASAVCGQCRLGQLLVAECWWLK
jgi:hypothetical protein